MPEARIDIHSNDAYEQLQRFSESIDEKDQIRGEVVGQKRDEDGKRTSLTVRLYTRKNNLSNKLMTRGRILKFQKARDGINHILKNKAGKPGFEHLNILESSGEKLVGERLKTAMDEKKVLVNSQTNLQNLNAFGQAVGEDFKKPKPDGQTQERPQMRGVKHGDGSITLYSERSRNNRTRAFARFDEGVARVYQNAGKKYPRLSDFLKQPKSEVDRAASKAKRGDFADKAQEANYNAACAGMVNRIDDIEDAVIDKLKTQQLTRDPFREAKGNIDLMPTMEKIKSGNIADCNPDHLILILKDLYRQAPTARLSSLGYLARTKAAFKAVGPYTARNNKLNIITGFKSEGAKKEKMDEGVQALKDQLRRLNPDEIKALKKRVQFINNLADAYTSQIAITSKFNGVPGDLRTNIVKSLCVNVQSLMGHPSEDLYNQVAGDIYQDLKKAVEGKPSAKELQKLFGQIRTYEHNMAPSRFSFEPNSSMANFRDYLRANVHILTDKKYNPEFVKQMNWFFRTDIGQIGRDLNTVLGKVRQESGSSLQDLLTASAMHQDVLFPPDEADGQAEAEAKRMESKIEDNKNEHSSRLAGNENILIEEETDVKEVKPQSNEANDDDDLESTDQDDPRLYPPVEDNSYKGHNSLLGPDNGIDISSNKKEI